MRASATLHGRHGDQRGRPPPALEHRPLADQRARAEVGDLLAVDVHLDDAVEQQVDGVGLLALLGERGALLQLADLRLALAHDHPRQLPLHGRLDLGDEGRRVLAAPRAEVAEGVAVPVLEVDQARSWRPARRRVRRPSGAGTGWRRRGPTRRDRRRGS